MWPHKNHKNLVKSIKLLKEKGIVVNVVLSGDSNSKNGDIVKEMIHQYNLQNQFTLVGIVNEAELYNLYKNSQGVVIPTLYEAGSFPLVESILMEIPVICSNITSLPETIGNQEFIFDPNSVENIGLGGAILNLNPQSRFLMLMGKLTQSILPFIWIYTFFAYFIRPYKAHRKSRALFIKEAKKISHNEFKRWYRLTATILPVLKRIRDKEMRTPILYIMGSHDYMFLPFVKKIVALHRSSSLITVANSGHVVNIDQPEEFNIQLLSFLLSD